MKHLRKISMIAMVIAVLFTACTKDDEAEIPSAAFGASSTTVEAGTPVTFTDYSLNEPTAWSWSFVGGDPETSTSTNPEVVYNTPGTYSVSLTVSNEAGSNLLERTDYITVIPAVPHAAFSVSQSIVDPGTEVTFTDESTGNPTSWTWEITNPAGNTYSYFTQNVTVTVNTIGFYNAKLTVINAEGSDQIVKNGVLEVYAKGIVIDNTTPSGIRVHYDGEESGYIASGESFKAVDVDGDDQVEYYIKTAAPHGLDLTTPTETVSANDQTISIEIDREFFFLTFNQQSFTQFNKEIINAGLQNEVTEYVNITAFDDDVAMGYYKLFSNTRIEIYKSDNTSYYYWENINWPSGNNVELELDLTGKKDGEIEKSHKVSSRIVEGDNVVTLK